MDLKSKKMAVDINAAQQAVPGLVFQWPFGWVPNAENRLELNLRRASLVQDTIEQLAATHHSAFKRPLRVSI